MQLRTCVHPSGKFIYGIHKPSFEVMNLREKDFLMSLGKLPDGQSLKNKRNFPDGRVVEESADWIFEVPNPFPFRGTTYIGKPWADNTAEHPSSIELPARPDVSFTKWLAENNIPKEHHRESFNTLPHPMLLSLASTSTDPEDLKQLADSSCKFIYNHDTGEPTGLCYIKDSSDRVLPQVINHELFEVVVNNIFLPDSFKKVMVLKPGVQGGSEIVGDWSQDHGKSHVFEYLRRNSYIPWGHYASNMAHDAVRYKIQDLTETDLRGLRHLYYQRTYVRLAQQLDIPHTTAAKTLSENQLENLRNSIIAKMRSSNCKLDFTATLWGWNFGFDYAASGYRLHASHQQIHQQFAMLPSTVATWEKDSRSGNILSYGCGDLVADFCKSYMKETGKNFFDSYLAAIASNRRMDGREDKENSLVVFEDTNVILFVPKAQTSKWELQLICKERAGNILETNTSTRKSLDMAILLAQRILEAIGAKMVTSIEFPKRFDSDDKDQRLIYSFLPKLPESMGAFSEAQLRWVMGHYPEDFAALCRAKLTELQS